MYRLKSIKNNVREFGVIHNNLFYKFRDSDYDLYQNDILIDKENQGYFSFDKYIGLNYKDYTVLINTLSNVKTTIPVIFTGRNFYNNSFVISKNTIREGIGLYSSNYTICQLFPFEKLYELPHRYYGSGYRFENQYIQIQNERKLIKSLSLLTGLYEWEVDLGVQGLKVGSILGVKEDNLIITCTDEVNKNILLALDIQTGKENWRTLAKDTQDFFPIFSPDKNSVFNLHTGHTLNGVIIRTRGVSIFREFNITDGSIKREGLLDKLDELGLIIKHFLLEGDKIYFMAAKGVFVPSVVGVLDYETLSLLWWEEVKMEEANGFGNFLTQIQASENKIYALDKTGTLHIYQRDESVPFVKPTKSGLVPFEDFPIQENTDNQDESDLPF